MNKNEFGVTAAIHTGDVELGTQPLRALLHRYLGSCDAVYDDTVSLIQMTRAHNSRWVLVDVMTDEPLVSDWRPVISLSSTPAYRVTLYTRLELSGDRRFVIVIAPEARGTVIRDANGSTALSLVQIKTQPSNLN